MPAMKIQHRLAWMASHKVVTIDVYINRSSEAKPYSKPSANVEWHLNKRQAGSKKASDAGVAVA